MPAICSNPAAVKLHCRQRDVWTRSCGHYHPPGNTDTTTLWAGFHTSWRLPHSFGTTGVIKGGIIRLRNDGDTWLNSIPQFFIIQQVCHRLFSVLLVLWAISFLVPQTQPPIPTVTPSVPSLCVRKKAHLATSWMSLKKFRSVSLTLVNAASPTPLTEGISHLWTNGHGARARILIHFGHLSLVSWSPLTSQDMR